MDSKFTKLGVSAAVLSMVCYFAGYFNFTAAIIMLVAVLWLSDSSVAKKNAIQAVLFAVFIQIASSALAMVTSGYFDLVGFLCDIIEDSSKLYSVLKRLDLAGYLNKLISLLELVAMIVFVCISAKGKVVNIPVVTKFLNKHIPEEPSTQA